MTLNARSLGITALLGVAVASAGGAQYTGGSLGGVTIGPRAMQWEFDSPVRQDSFSVTRVRQAFIPITIAGPMSQSWNLEIHGGYAFGEVEVNAGGETRKLTLAGPTDIKVRLNGRLFSDHVVLTLGATGPTGAVRLSGERLDALRVIGAPALRMPAPVLGSGVGGAAGLVFVKQVLGWGIAVGSTYEYRGKYAPMEAEVAGVKLPTDLDPGDALHFSVGVDRVFGEHRVSLVALRDTYRADELSITDRDYTATSSVQLGPSTTFLGRLDLGVPHLRELSITLLDRKRSPFALPNGDKAPGSNGNVFEAGVAASVGRPQSIGLFLRVDGIWDSGLDIDQSIATAAMTSAALSVGVTIPAGNAMIVPFGRIIRGQLDTGPQTVNGHGLAVGLSIGPR
jgi:hypothetical protein